MRYVHTSFYRNPKRKDRQFRDIGVRGRIILTRNSGTTWVGSGKFLLVLASTVGLGFFLFLPRLLRVLKWGLLFKERSGQITTGHSPSTGE
jgi:hypothetical protein